MPSSIALPSLVTVVDRLRLMCGRNRLWRKEDFSDFGVDVPSPCLSLPPLLPSEFIRKKFFIFCDTWLLEPLTWRLEEIGKPVNVRFSCDRAEWFDIELKSWVILRWGGKHVWGFHENKDHASSLKIRAKKVWKHYNRWQTVREKLIRGVCPFVANRFKRPCLRKQ